MIQFANPEDRFLFAPDEPAAAAVETPAAPTETPAASAVSTPAAAASTTSDASSGATATPAAASTPASTPAVSWLDSFRKEGFNAPDENTARQQLLQAYRDAERLKPLAPAVSAYQQNAAQFHAWQAQQLAAQRQPAPQDWTQAVGWNPPEWNPAWQSQVTIDDKGNIIAAPGAPADVALKFQQYSQYRKDFTEKFLSNPGKALEPYIRHVATEIAAQYAQQNVGQYKEQQEAQSFISKNENWLFDKGQDGGVKTQQVFNPQTGRHESQKVLSNWGQMFLQNLQTYAQKGLDPESQQNLALQAVQNAYMASPEYVQWAYQQINPAPVSPAAPAASPRAQANAAFTQRANPAQAPAAGKGGNAVAAPQKVTRENLEATMLARFREAGVTI